MKKPFITRTVREIPHVEQPAMRYAKKRGWMFEKVVSQSRKGWPDRLAIRNGVVLFVEFKRPGEEPTAQQLLRHAEIRAHGGTVVWIDNMFDAELIFY